MGYTKHTWVNNETITATKLNDMEEGISMSNGGRTPIIKLVFPDGVSSGSKYFSFALCKYNNGTYSAQIVATVDDVVDTLRTVAIYSPFNAGEEAYILCPIPLPADDDLYLAICNPYGFICTYNGNVGSSNVTINYGSTANGRIITGDFTLSLVVD